MNRHPRSEPRPAPALLRELAELGQADFRTGFEARLLARLGASEEPDWGAWLGRLFPRLAIPAAALVAALALWNLSSGEGDALERLLRLQPVTVEAAIDYWAEL